MNSEQFTDLVWKSQTGDEAAMEELLLKSYGPVSYLAGKILQNEDLAVQVTREVLEIISGKLQSLGDPDQFRKWMCRVTAARCMQVMPLFRQTGSNSAAPSAWQDQLTDGETLNEEQSALVIQQMVDSLPQNQRLCILLLGCGGLTVAAIAQLTGFSESTVADHIQQGQAAIQQHLWELQARNVQLSGLSSLTGILRVAMFCEREEADAVPVVYGILGKEVPVPPDPEKQIIRTLSVILVILILAVLIAGGVLILKLLPRPEIPDILPTTLETTLATTVATDPTTIPTETTEPTVETTTETTLPKTTEATMVPPSAATTPPAANPPAAAKPQAPSDAPATGEDGHTHKYTVISSSYDCENGGSKTHQCSICGLCYEETVSGTGSHTFTTVIPKSDPTCTKAGEVTKLCSVCGYGYVAEDSSRPALGHNYVTHVVVAPTATSQGYTNYRCTRCGDAYDADYVDPISSDSNPPVSETPTPDPTA